MSRLLDRTTKGLNIKIILLYVLSKWDIMTMISDTVRRHTPVFIHVMDNASHDN